MAWPLAMTTATTRGRKKAAGGGGSGTNLLVAPEDFADAAWAKVAVTVAEDTGDPTHPNADQLVMPSGRFVRQVSGVPATAGSGTSSGTGDGVWGRRSVTASFDGVDYTYSIELLPSSNWQIKIAIVGGFIAASINASSGTSTVLAWGAKLEQGSSFSGYP